MNERDILNCPNCPFNTNAEGQICRAALVPALALLIRDEIIDRASLATGQPESLLHSLRNLAPVAMATQLACEAVLSVKLEKDLQGVA